MDPAPAATAQLDGEDSTPTLSTQNGSMSAALELAKLGIVRMVLISTAVGYLLSLIGSDPSFGKFAGVAVWTMLGTALSAGGANALNQAIEWRRDGLMKRTKDRPVPSGRMDSRAAYRWGVGMSVAGICVLWIGAGIAPALVSAGTILSYVLLYTPMKATSPLSTLVGAVPGALPPLVGWCAGARLRSESEWLGLIEMGGWSLFALMFAWQVPHVMAICWKYRDEYEAGGYKTLPSMPDGPRRTSRATLTWSVALVPISLAPVLAIDGGPSVAYIAVALVLGLLFVYASARLAITRSDRDATLVFVASIAYLPLVLLAMVGDALVLQPVLQ